MKKKYKIKIYWKQILLVEIILAISFLIPYNVIGELENYGFPFSVITINRIYNFLDIRWDGLLYNVFFYSAIVLLLNVMWIKIKKKRL